MNRRYQEELPAFPTFNHGMTCMVNEEDIKEYNEQAEAIEKVVRERLTGIVRWTVDRYDLPYMLPEPDIKDLQAFVVRGFVTVSGQRLEVKVCISRFMWEGFQKGGQPMIDYLLQQAVRKMADAIVVPSCHDWGGLR